MMYYIVCKSLTYAQRAALVLRDSGIRVSLLRSPKGISDTGCSYSLRLSTKQLSKALVVLNQSNLSPVKVFIDPGDGNYREVGV